MMLTPLDLLPGWVPSDALLLGTVLTAIAILQMNKGRPWFINVLALDEPVLVGLGGTVLFLAWDGWFESVLPMVPGELFWALGAGMAVLGLAAFFSDDLDISGFIG